MQFNSKRGNFLVFDSKSVGDIPSLFIQGSFSTETTYHLVSRHGKRIQCTTEDLNNLSRRNNESLNEILLLTRRFLFIFFLKPTDLELLMTWFSRFAITSALFISCLILWLSWIWCAVSLPMLLSQKVTVVNGPFCFPLMLQFVRNSQQTDHLLSNKVHMYSLLSQIHRETSNNGKNPKGSLYSCMYQSLVS